MGPIYEVIWGAMVTFGDLWVLMGGLGRFGVLRVPVVAYVDLWRSLGSRGVLWGPIQTYGDHWGTMGLYGNLGWHSTSWGSKGLQLPRFDPIRSHRSA